jgi:hypothetical protein
VSEQYGEPFHVAWAPDGRTMYYISKGTHGSYIHATSPSGGGARLLVRFEDPTRQHTRYGFDTDGRVFYFTLGAHESDVWVGELGKN